MNIFKNYEDVKYFYSVPDVIVVFLFLPRPWGFHKSFDGWHEYLWCGITHFDETRAGRSRYSKQDPLFCGLTIWYMCKSERNVSSMKSMCKSTWTLLATHPKPPTPNPAYKPSKSQEMPNKHGRFSCRSNYQVHPDRIQKLWLILSNIITLLICVHFDHASYL